MKKKTWVIIGCVVIAGAAVAVGTRMGQESKPVSAGLSQITISAARPEVGDLSLTGSFIGTVEPEQKVQVFPKVSGTVLRTHYEVGQQVNKGDLLYEIDPEPYQMQYDAAAAKIDAQRVQGDVQLGSSYDMNLINAKSALDRAQIGLDKARNDLRDYNQATEDTNEDAVLALKRQADKAHENYVGAQEAAADYLKVEGNTSSDPAYKTLMADVDKMEKLYLAAYANHRDADAGDDSAHRALRTAYASAQDSYNAAKATYDMMTGVSKDDAKTSLDAGLNAAEVGLEASAKQVEYTKVYAPIDGVVEQKLVNDHDISAPSAPAYVVSNKSVMTVKFSVSESVVGNLSVGEKIRIENGGKTVDGTVIEIPTMVDAQSGLFNIKASVDDADIPLHTGSNVKVYAATEKAQGGLLLTSDSLYYDEAKPYVYVYKDGKAVKTPVETGISTADRIQIVSGIAAGDEVINSWHPRLLDGADVVLKDASVPAAAAASSEAAPAAQ